METRFNLVDLSDELWLYWIKDSSDKITGYSPESSYRCLDLWKFQCCDILFCWWIEYLLKVWENLQKVFAPTFPIRPLCQTYWLPSWEETTTIIIFRRIIQWNLSTFFTRNQEQDWIKWHHHASRNQNLKNLNKPREYGSGIVYLKSFLWKSLNLFGILRRFAKQFLY